MEMTQQDYDDRKARVDDGSGTDEDQRLVRQYEDAGYTATPAKDRQAKHDEAGRSSQQAERGAGGVSHVPDAAAVPGQPATAARQAEAEKSAGGKSGRGSGRSDS